MRLRGRLRGERVGFGRDPAEELGERDAIARAFCGLNESQREVLRLISWEGLGPEEAAVALGCSNGAFRVRLHRARAALAKQLGAVGHEAGESGAREPLTGETK
jgi:RNA polymerase sigma-70 factor (ECF subfamily)